MRDGMDPKPGKCTYLQANTTPESLLRVIQERTGHRYKRLNQVRQDRENGILVDDFRVMVLFAASGSAYYCDKKGVE